MEASLPAVLLPFWFLFFFTPHTHTVGLGSRWCTRPHVSREGISQPFVCRCSLQEFAPLQGESASRISICPAYLFHLVGVSSAGCLGGEWQRAWRGCAVFAQPGVVDALTVPVLDLLEKELLSVA